MTAGGFPGNPKKYVNPHVEHLRNDDFYSRYLFPRVRSAQRAALLSRHKTLLRPAPSSRRIPVPRFTIAKTARYHLRRNAFPCYSDSASYQSAPSPPSRTRSDKCVNLFATWCALSCVPVLPAKSVSVCLPTRRDMRVWHLLLALGIMPEQALAPHFASPSGPATPPASCRPA